MMCWLFYIQTLVWANNAGSRLLVGQLSRAGGHTDGISNLGETAVDARHRPRLWARTIVEPL